MRALFVLLAVTLPLAIVALLRPALRPELVPLLLVVGATALVFAILAVLSRGRHSAPLPLRFGALGNVTEKIARAINDMTGMQFIGGVRASLNFASINAGLQERLTMTVTGALLGDFAQVSPETDLTAGLSLAEPYVSAADTVTVTLVNNTAGALDEAAIVFRARVTREAKR